MITKLSWNKHIPWNKHIDCITSKAEKRLSLLKRLSGKKWGCSQETLNTTYNVYIKPVVTYCGETLITANLKKVKLLENQSLRLITGAVKSTPITAMQLLAHQTPIEYELEKIAAFQYAKLIRLPFNSWEKRKFEIN